MTKSTPMKMLERMHKGKPIDQIVREVVAKHDSPEPAAAELGVSLVTFRKWRSAFCSETPEVAVSR